MRNMRWSLAGLFACGLPVACADPCIDDGLGQAAEGTCPQADGGQTDTESNGNTETVSDTLGTATIGSNTDAMTDSQNGTDTVGETLDGTDTDTDTNTNTDTDTATVGETDSETDTAGGSLWCVDADGDGFGDPTMCQQSDEPIPGSVDNEDDCDDGNENTFPGAAPNDDPRACMNDEDGDDWGDNGSGGDLPPGVMPGSDCLDEDSTVFPGAASNETPPDLCAQDEDGDGWGDANPPPGADPGTDCLDEDAGVFPGAADQEPELCAEDGDGDGWGDTNPPPGADPGNDCDDDSPFTFPGAAPNDDPMACMQDEDGDDWGDDTPPAGVIPGTDCDDTNPDAFPGAAFNETLPGLCTVDSDGDGWGDANPGGGGGGGSGPVGGSDCYPNAANLNPDTLQLTAFMPFNGAMGTPRTLVSVDPNTAVLTPFVTLQTPMGTVPNVDFVTATLTDTGGIIANDLTSDQLFTVEYQATCAMGTGVVSGLGSYDIPGIEDLMCGLEFDGSGNLFGIDNGDVLVTFDPVSGQAISTLDITLGGAPFDINSCGMAYDCGQDRMLVANGSNWRIYEIDTTTGAVTELRNLDPFFGPAWSPVGLAWNSVERLAYLSTGGNLYAVDIDDPAAPPVNQGAYGGAQQVSNLQYLPVCGP